MRHCHTARTIYDRIGIASTPESLCACHGAFFSQVVCRYTDYAATNAALDGQLADAR